MKLKLKEKSLKILSVAEKTTNGYLVTSIRIKKETKNRISRV